MSEEMIEQRRLVEQWDATSEFATDDLYLFTAALVGATRAALSAYNYGAHSARWISQFKKGYGA